MPILLCNPYLVKVTTKGEGESKIPKILTTWFMDDPKALFPSNGAQPDFHALEYFQNLDFEIDQKTISQFWKNALNKNCTSFQ